MQFLKAEEGVGLHFLAGSWYSSFSPTFQCHIPMRPPCQCHSAVGIHVVGPCRSPVWWGLGGGSRSSTMGSSVEPRC